MAAEVDPGRFARRREAYMRAIGDDAVAVLHSPPELVRNGDAHHKYRQSSDLVYLTGFAEPGATLVLRPGQPAGQRVVLFVRPRDPEREIWDGRRAGVEGALARFGADLSYPAGELAARLPELLANVTDLHYAVGVDAAFDRTIMATVARLRGSERRGLAAPRRIVDPRGALHEHRLIKTADEIATLKRAAAITAEAHAAAMRLAAPGVNERELEAVIDYTFRRRGGSGPGYATIVGAGDNATILHYVENDAALAEGDLVLVDAGCELDFYTADVTRAFPVSGTFSRPQRAIYDVVLAAEEACIAMTRPGVTLDDLHARAVEILTQGMVDLGLLDGAAADRIADGGYKAFYMHRTSHWLGMDVHDVGAYLEPDGSPRRLAPGMVLTIEPGLYVAQAAAGVPDALRGIGVRIEDDILVTATGCEILTGDTPKQPADVERACRG
jgi:Xaa-Pro aminopeptidase